MSKNKKVKPVSFNKTKDKDVKMLKHLEGMNFGGYVKDLIWADIQKKESALKIVQRSGTGGIKIVIRR